MFIYFVEHVLYNIMAYCSNQFQLAELGLQKANYQAEEWREKVLVVALFDQSSTLC